MLFNFLEEGFGVFLMCWVVERGRGVYLLENYKVYYVRVGVRIIRLNIWDLGVWDKSFNWFI